MENVCVFNLSSLTVRACTLARSKEPEREVIDAWESHPQQTVTMPDITAGTNLADNPNNDQDDYSNGVYANIGSGQQYEQQTSFEETIAPPTNSNPPIYAQAKKKTPAAIYDNSALIASEDDTNNVYGYAKELP